MENIKNIAMRIRYDGTNYHGWQSQSNGVTVQSTIEKALSELTGSDVKVTGCSRTDAGVHANMFCCTLDTACPLRGDKLAAALNAHLPADVAVYGCREVPADFHPRYMAAGKRYVYRIWNAPARNPFWQGYALHRQRRLDERRMDEAAAAYCGTHDFTAFKASGGLAKTTVRTILSARVSAFPENLFYLEICGDGFLYNMVRIIAGTLIRVGGGEMAPDEIPQILGKKDRTAAGPTAPAHGLTMMGIEYEDAEGISET